MESKIALVKNFLDGFLKEVEDLREQIKTTGNIPKVICEFCNEKRKRTMVEFQAKEIKSLNQFKEWVKDFNIMAISSIMLKTKDDLGARGVYFETPDKLAGIKSEAKGGKGFIYILDLSAPSKKSKMLFKKYTSLRSFLSKYEKIESCPHFEGHPENILKVEFRAKIRLIPSGLLTEGIGYKLFLCCNDCKNRIENTMCERVEKHGFLFDFGCPLEDIILQKRLVQKGLSFENLEEEETNTYRVLYYSRSRSIYYLRQHSILILLIDRVTDFYLENRLRNVVKHIAPELIVSFDAHSNLPQYLELGTNIIFFNQDGIYFYDKDRKPEGDIGTICEKIINNLNNYIEKERGREHDRIISALSSIGQELGYVLQKEYNKSGVRIDCVWFDRKGRIQVAVEVETTSTWKKDLISTWEVEPKLAIIVSSPKTDKITKNLIELSLMKSIPHYVLLINKGTDHAFLFDKQEIIKYYTLNKAEEDNNFSDIQNL